MTPTVSEPTRDDDVPVWDPFELVRCDLCVHGTVAIERRGRFVKRMCRACGGTGRRLRGNPPESPYVLCLDFTGGAGPCSKSCTCWPQQGGGAT